MVHMLRFVAVVLILPLIAVAILVLSTHGVEKSIGSAGKVSQAQRR